MCYVPGLSELVRTVLMSGAPSMIAVLLSSSTEDRSRSWTGLWWKGVVWQGDAADGGGRFRCN